MSEPGNEEAWGSLIEAWISSTGEARVQIAAWQMEDPRDFGRFLADVARHGALAFATTYSMNEGTALEEICAGLSKQLREQDSELIIEQPGKLD